MSINIENREAEALLAELKHRTGKGTADLLLGLLRQEKDRLERDAEDRLQVGLEANRRLRESWLAGAVVDSRPIEDILAYGDDGLPL